MLLRYIFSWLILFILLNAFSLTEVSALESSTPNNKFGIHLATPSKEELESAAKLVNTHGGNWGYVTVVIQDNDRNKVKWQEAFDHMRELRLIPIIRLATSPVGDYWAKPTEKEIENWISFLNSLRWVTKDRYIILFNEPNHSLEWGGELNPEEYARVSYEYAKSLKSSNSDYFIMLAGLDLAAASNGVDLDAYSYIERMYQEKKELKDIVDGLSSHSYPNPGFRGSPYDSGRTSIRGYEWELRVLKEFGVTKDLPVFITETGWTHNGTDSNDIAGYFRTAFEIWQLDDRIRAVTPFILSYQGEPFLKFSWKKFGSEEFYSHYYVVEAMPKVSGSPSQIQKGGVVAELPKDLLARSVYHFRVKLRNEGQAVWTGQDGYKLQVAPLRQGSEGQTGFKPKDIEYFFANIDDIKPGEERDVDLYIKTSEQGGPRQLKIGLYKNDKRILDEAGWTFQVLPLPSLNLKTSMVPRIRSEKNREFEVQIFNDKQELVFKQKGLKRDKGELVLPEVKNVYLKGTFRVVVLSRYYLPRQTFVSFESGQNKASMKALLPLDLYPDGAFTWKDIWELTRNPQLLSLLLP